MGKQTEPEKIVRLLRAAGAELAGGKTVAQVVQKLGVSEQRTTGGGSGAAACRWTRPKD